MTKMRIFLLSALFAIVAPVRAGLLRRLPKITAAEEPQHRALFDHDMEFWDQFIHDTISTSFTVVPSLAPTAAPSESPSGEPSAAPTVSPSIPPECVLDLNIACPDCEPGPTVVEPCTARPLEIGMLYAGGDCSLSAQCQDEGKFSCTDYNGGPPSVFGEPSYIVAMDNKEREVFFEGWVPVGSTFIMDSGFERFPADQSIKTYSSNVTSEDTLLQHVLYHSSCSQNLDLLNRFGSHGKRPKMLVFSLLDW
jgi:hypothetical protein